MQFIGLVFEVNISIKFSYSFTPRNSFVTIGLAVLVEHV